MRTHSLIAAVLSIASCTDELELAESADELTRSPSTTDHPAVITVSMSHADGSGSSCTASMLSRHWLLLAAHCVVDYADGDRVHVRDADRITLFDGPAHFDHHPDYNPDLWDWEDDLGLIRLDGAGVSQITEQAGVWSGPITEGDKINVIGFGLGTDPDGSEYCDDGTSGTKRIQDYTLTNVESQILDIDYGDARVCPGDSGGPWFKSFEGRLLVAGTTSAQTPFNDATACRVELKEPWLEDATAGGTNSLSWAWFVTGTHNVYYEAFEGAQKVRFASAGSKHACAVLMDGRVRCWGDNAYGQLGNSSTLDTRLPVTADRVDAWKLSAGAHHTCAVTKTDELRCWGSNSKGQLGNPALTVGASYSGAQVVQFANGTPLTDVRWVAAGSAHTCAVTHAGRVYCWGDNTFGQLGNDDTAASTQPTLVGHLDEPVKTPARTIGGPLRVFVPLEGVAQLDAGDRHTCAVTTAGVAHCWGYNAWGQLGNNTTTTSRIPVALRLADVFRISAGYGHTCATYGSGGDRAACWGMNALGQLGLGNQTNRLTPATVAVGLGISLEVSAGKYHTCFTGSDRQKCAGDNGRGALGAPLLQMYTSLVESTIEHDTLAPSAGDGFTCTVMDSGSIACSGSNSDGQLATGEFPDLPWFNNARDVHHLPDAAP
ncbi:MAG: trypsin-like serine protease [Kofleriaceae bacterium]